MEWVLCVLSLSILWNGLRSIFKELVDSTVNLSGPVLFFGNLLLQFHCLM
jgi:hypothetical protein